MVIRCKSESKGDGIVNQLSSRLISLYCSDYATSNGNMGEKVEEQKIKVRQDEWKEKGGKERKLKN